MATPATPNVNDSHEAAAHGLVQDELVLRPDLTRQVSDHFVEISTPELSATLRLVNGGDRPLGYKAKTNTPRRWLVRPNSGVIEPGSSLSVIFTLLSPLAESGQNRAGLIDARSLSDDRFLLISAPVSPDEAAALRCRADGSRADVACLHEEHASSSLSWISVRLFLRPPPIDSPLRSPTSAASASPVPVQPPPPCLVPPMTPEFSGLSVAQQISRIQTAHPHGERNGGVKVEGSGGGAYTPYSDQESDGSSDSSADGPTTLAGKLLTLLLSPLDELEPWFKWKVFDILWAVGLLLLAKRVKWVARLQKALDL